MVHRSITRVSQVYNLGIDWKADVGISFMLRVCFVAITERRSRDKISPNLVFSCARKHWGGKLRGAAQGAFCSWVTAATVPFKVWENNTDRAFRRQSSGVHARACGVAVSREDFFYVSKKIKFRFFTFLCLMLWWLGMWGGAGALRDGCHGLVLEGHAWAEWLQLRVHS
jgi:hypothetical protein